MLITFQHNYPHLKFVENVENSLNGFWGQNQAVENQKTQKFSTKNMWITSIM